MHLTTALLVPTLVGLASAIALPPADRSVRPGLVGLEKRGWNWAAVAVAPPAQFPPHPGPFANWKHMGCYSNDAGFWYDTGLCACHPPAHAQHFTMDRCFAACKGAGFRYAGIKGTGAAKKCMCTSEDPSDFKFGSLSNCNVPCNEGDHAASKGYLQNYCGGGNTYSVWRDPCFKKYNMKKAFSGYKPAECWWPLHGWWLLAVKDNAVSGDNLSIESCNEACANRGLAYAATYWGTQCYCGGKILQKHIDHHNLNPLNPNQYCNAKCSATAKTAHSTDVKFHQFCGGNGYYSLQFNKELFISDNCEDEEEIPTVTVTLISTYGQAEPTKPPAGDEKTKTIFVTKAVPFTKTLTFFPGKPEPTMEPEDYNKTETVVVTVTGKPVKFVTLYYTITKGVKPSPKPKYDPAKTVLVTTTVEPEEEEEVEETPPPTKITKTITVYWTRGSPSPKPVKTRPGETTKVVRVDPTDAPEPEEPEENPNPKITKTVTIYWTRGRPKPTPYKTKPGEAVKTVEVDDEPEEETKTVRRPAKTVTLTWYSPNGKRPTIPKPSPAGTVYVTKTTKGPEPTNGNPGGKPAEENPDEEKPDEEKPDEEKPDEEKPDEEKPDEEKPDEENPDEENPDNKPTPGGKPAPGPSSTKKPTTKPTDEPEPEEEEGNGKPGGKPSKPKPGDEGPPLDDTLCAAPEGSKYPVGGIKAPAVSCNNDKTVHPKYPFKLYVGPGTAWPKANCPLHYEKKAARLSAACLNACLEQKKDCLKSAAVKKMSGYQNLCEAQDKACQAANAPARLSKVADTYCAKPALPFPKPPKAGGKPGKPDTEDIGYF
ncbi:hypothetical protein TWF481_004101 [Arthrobotrys musiformis]|uniref:WSC domain-containing protein n=1 Tax=Arthrobotrys musiformis TaxID=47236 RepID=A0AAV9WKL0_9PEZI